MQTTLYIVIGIFALLLIVLIGMYNGFVSRRNAVDNAFASLDANLQKRFDLVPNLVATVKGYMNHERETLEALVKLRGEANSPQRRLQNDGAAAQLLGQVMVLAEGYPELKASDNFMHLQRTLNEVEEQISASRRTFNATVNEYNTSVETFPGNILAGMFGFSRRAYFDAGDAARQAPTIAGQF